MTYMTNPVCADYISYISYIVYIWAAYVYDIYIHTHLSYLYIHIHIYTAWIYYFVKCSGFLPIFFILLLVIFLLVCWNFLCILDTSSIYCIFSQFINFSFTFSPFCIHLKKTFAYSKIRKLFSYFLTYKLYYFCIDLQWSKITFLCVWCKVVKVHPSHSVSLYLIDLISFIEKITFPSVP